MAKRLSQLDRGIRELEDHIRERQMELRGLEMARDHLVLQRATPPAPKAKPTPRRTPGLPRVLAHAGDEAS